MSLNQYTDSLIVRTVAKMLEGLKLGSTSSPDSKAILDLESTTKGMLFPRMTETQRDAISSPPTGLTIFNTTTNKINAYNGVAWAEVGSGSGQGGINYISKNNGNSDFEVNAAGWSAYADAAGSSPVDGTGGSPTVTITRTTSSPLRDTGSGLITKDAADRQGEGVSYDFTIDSADQAKPLVVSFDYEPSSDFAAGDSSDLRIYILDVTNSRLIQPAPYTLQGGSGSKHRFQGIFQTSADSTSYRLIFHVATTNANAWTFKFDNVSVGPESVAYGPPVTDWADFNATGTWTTNTTYLGKFRRVGDTIELWYQVTLSGAPDATDLAVNLPAGLSIDTTKLTSIADNRELDGFAIIMDGGGHGEASTHKIIYITASQVKPLTEAGGNLTDTVPITFASGDRIFIRVNLPILGWSSTVQMSNDTLNRVVAARYRISSSSANISFAHATEEIVDFDDKVFDTTNSVTTGANWKFTAPVSGIYRVSTSIHWDSYTDMFLEQVQLYVNGAVAAVLVQASVSEITNRQRSGSCLVQLNAGDEVNIRAQQNDNGGLARDIDDYSNIVYVDIERLSGPSVIAATETISADYRQSGNQAITSGAETHITTLDTKIWDTHGAYSGNVFTAPISGKYRVDFSIEFSNNGTSYRFINVYKNGVKYRDLEGAGTVSGSNTTRLSGTTVVPMNTGDYLAFTVNTGDDVNAQGGYFTITREGN